MIIAHGSLAPGKVGSGGGIIAHCPVLSWMAPISRPRTVSEGGRSGRGLKKSSGEPMARRNLENLHSNNNAEFFISSNTCTVSRRRRRFDVGAWVAPRQAGRIMSTQIVPARSDSSVNWAPPVGRYFCFSVCVHPDPLRYRLLPISLAETSIMTIRTSFASRNVEKSMLPFAQYSESLSTQPDRGKRS